MNTLKIEDVKDIIVSTTKVETDIELIDKRGSPFRLELSRKDAEYLSGQLTQALNKI